MKETSSYVKKDEYNRDDNSSHTNRRRDWREEAERKTKRCKEVEVESVEASTKQEKNLRQLQHNSTLCFTRTGSLPFATLDP